MEKIHPLTLAVLKGAFESVVNEMDTTLIRTAFSAVICEAEDQANGIYEAATGDVIAQGYRGLPVFVGTMQFAVRSVIERAASIGVGPGDVIVMNDPYLGGTHLMDMKFVAPFYYQGELVAWVANTGHWTDVGGGTPGGFSGTAEEIFQEGLRLPPVKLFANGQIVRDVETIMMANMRVPEERQGDIRAHLNALIVGQRRLAAVIDKYGLDTVRAFWAELKARSEQQMRSVLAEIPQGVYAFTDYLDNDGVTDEPVKLHVDITVGQGDIHFDFSKSAPPLRGPMNSVLSSTMSACYIALMHLFPELPVNAGCFAPVRFTIPETTFLNAKYPKPVSGCAAETSQRVVDLVFGALAEAIPERVSAGAFATIVNFTLGGEDPETGRYVLYLMAGGGYGGNKEFDGLSHMPATIGTSRAQPVELLEHRYPVRFRCSAMRPDSAGPGRRRGGFGAVYEFELLRGSAVASCVGDRGKFPPFGILGGKPGACMKLSFRISGEWMQPPAVSKASRIQLHAGDLVRLEMPGGGGYGDPAEREPELVAIDLKRRLYTSKAAAGL